MMSYGNKRVDLVDFGKKSIFFVTAFIPLWAILIINYGLTENADWAIILISSVPVLLSFVCMMRHLQKLSSTTELNYFKVVKKEDITHNMVFYILAYVSVLLVNNYDYVEWPTFVILLLTIFVLYVKTNMLHINPILLLMKYNTYRVTDDHDNTVILLSKLNVKTGVEIPYAEVTTNINLILDRQE